MYGIIDLGLQYLKTRQVTPGERNDGSYLGLASGVQSGSRFGLKGISDIGGGTSVRFVLENGFNPGNGTLGQGGLLFGRQSTIGIENSNIGQVDFGRQINLASNYFLPIDPFKEGFGQANIGASFGSANTLRYSNMILAQSASLGGFTFGAGYAFSTALNAIYADNGSCTENACNGINSPYQYETGNNLRALTLGVRYQQGPMLIAAAYDQLNGPNNIPNGPPSPNLTAWMLGGQYDFTSIAVSAVIGQTRNGGLLGQTQGTGNVGLLPISNSTFGADALFASNFSKNSYMLGINIPSGASNIIASWQMMQPTGEYRILGSGNQTSGNQIIYSVGYLYSLSKRTNVYAYASYANNYAMIESANSMVAGIGLRHQF